jgi:hypothetical protein
MIALVRPARLAHRDLAGLGAASRDAGAPSEAPDGDAHPVPVPSAAASRRDAPMFAVALAARPVLLPAGRPPGRHDPAP